ncbi:MAG TPA: O-antigen ligase family protein [Verrucomicrobiae bacterium]|nr:O-antigen ligase family protein [Verrucomicrobiae bacterium]
MSQETVDRWCERGVLYLVLAILTFGPLAIGAVRGFDFAIIEGLTLGVMALWAIRLWVSPRPQLLWPPICWAVIAFSLYAVGRYLTADIEYVARQEVLHVLVYAFLFLAILNNLHRQETTQIISFALVFLAMAISFYAVYQFLTDSNYVWGLPKAYPHRGSGTYINPNDLAGFLEMLLPIGLAYALVGRLKPVTRILLSYASLAILAGIAVTISRGGWVSTGVALTLLLGALAFRRRYRLPVLVLAVVAIGVGAFLLPKSFFIQSRIKQTMSASNKVNDDMRFAIWAPAWRMWQDHPWWGVGPAHFDARFHQYRPEGVQLSPVRTHNDYLNTLVDWGVTGLALVLAAVALLFFGVWKTRSSVRLSSGELGGKSGSNKFAFVLGASLGLVAILVHSFVDFNMHIPANAILAVTLMALLSSHLRFATERYWFTLKVWSRVLASALLFLGGAYVAQQAWRLGTEALWLDRAERAPVFSAKQIDLLSRAFASDPMNPETALSIGEAFRRESQEGGEFYQGQQGANYRTLAEQAMTWYQRGMKLNPWDSRNYSGYGWCLDWLDRQAESAPYFSQAEELDPNNYFNLNNIGLHYIQAGDFAAAKPWFERSLRLEWHDNPIAQNYLQIANMRLLDAATNELSARLGRKMEAEK